MAGVLRPARNQLQLGGGQEAPRVQAEQQGMEEQEEGEQREQMREEGQGGAGAGDGEPEQQVSLVTDSSGVPRDSGLPTWEHAMFTMLFPQDTGGWMSVSCNKA